MNLFYVALVLTAIVVIGLLIGAIAPQFWHAVARWSSDLVGRNYDVLIKSERRSLMATRISCILALVFMAATVLFMFYMLSH